MLQESSNEQKLTYVYEIIKDQESRRKRHAFYRVLKWLIIGGLAYLVITNPDVIITQVTKYVKPLVMEQAKSMMEENKKNFMESMRNLLPDEEIVIPAKTTPTPKKTPTK